MLAEVVAAERPDLEELKAHLTKQQNDFKIMLKDLEDDLLSRLSSAGENILGDTALVENLETTKRTATEIEEKVPNGRSLVLIISYITLYILSIEFRLPKQKLHHKKSILHVNSIVRLPLEPVSFTSYSMT